MRVHSYCFIGAHSAPYLANMVASQAFGIGFSAIGGTLDGSIPAGDVGGYMLGNYVGGELSDGLSDILLVNPACGR